MRTLKYEKELWPLVLVILLKKNSQQPNLLCFPKIVHSSHACFQGPVFLEDDQCASHY